MLLPSESIQRGGEAFQDPPPEMTYQGVQHQLELESGLGLGREFSF